MRAYNFPMRAFLLSALLLTLAACGLKDDLYLPETPTVEPAAVPADEASPAPEDGSGTEAR